MINSKKNKTRPLFDPWGHLGERRRALLEKGWPAFFRGVVLPRLPVGALEGEFSREMGRPTKELESLIGALVLQQVFDLTDDETANSYAFRVDWHYALDMAGEGDGEKYVSERTLRGYRERLVETGLAETLFEGVTDALLKGFGVETGHQRLDSTLIRSNMRRLTRVELCRRVLGRLLRQLQREAPEAWGRIPEEIRERYGEGERGCFGLKPSQARQALLGCGEALWTVLTLLSGEDGVQEWECFRQAKQVLGDQFTVRGTEGRAEIEVKGKGEMTTDSLQNPTDGEARYDGHKGAGYYGQVLETYSPKAGDPEQVDGPAQPNLVTHVAVTPANVVDETAVGPALEETQRRGISPETLVADGAYGSDEVVEGVQAQGVTLVAPARGPKPRKGLEGFEMNDTTGEMLRCPQGETPIQVILHQKRPVAIFSHVSCNGCPRKESCPAVRRKRGRFVRYTAKEIRLARRRQAMETEAFQEKYRWRAGIEGTISQYKNQMGGGRIRYRGLAKVTFAVKLKFLGLNVFRSVAAWLEMIKKRGGECPFFKLLKEFFGLLFRWMQKCLFTSLEPVFPLDFLPGHQL